MHQLKKPLTRLFISKLRDGVDQLQQTIKNPRMQRAAAASSGSTAAHGKSLSSLPTNFARHATFVGSEEVEDDWTPRTQNFEQQQPLLQQQQLQLLRLQKDELDFEAGVVEDRRSNLSQISKDAAQVGATVVLMRRAPCTARYGRVTVSFALGS
jgi:hypothetical protein